MTYEQALALRQKDASRYKPEARRSMGEPVPATLEVRARGSIVFRLTAAKSGRRPKGAPF